jgi:CRISPR/Cas system-associated exonuclease Cas4 (RecB family)
MTAKKTAVVSRTVARITAWSYSRWRDYKVCPAYAKFKYVNKLKEPGSPAMDRGSAIHQIAEDYVRKGSTKARMPRELMLLSKRVKLLCENGAVPEAQWAFNSKWVPVDWFASDAWCRVKADVWMRIGNELTVVDYKTGQKRDGYEDQLDLYALGALLQFPDVTLVKPEIWYVDSGEVVDGITYTRLDVKRLQKQWESRTRIMLLDTRFSPNPNYICRRCHFRKANGGPCTF